MSEPIVDPLLPICAECGQNTTPYLAPERSDFPEQHWSKCCHAAVLLDGNEQGGDL